MKSIFRLSGFTLYEMMTVIAVIAVITGISLFNYLSWVPGIRLNAAARQVMSDLTAARMSSIKENASVAVSLVNNHAYEIAVGDRPATIKDFRPDYPGVVINFTTVIFTSRGTTSPKTLTLQNSYGIKKITVAITGRIKIY